MASNHIDTAEFKAETIIEQTEAQAIETQKQAKEKAEGYLSSIEISIEAEHNKSIPKKKKAVATEMDSLRTKNAAYKEHIAIKNRDTEYLFEQLQQAERQEKVNDTSFRMVSDMINAYPNEFDALLKKLRAKKNLSTPFKSNNNAKSGK